MEKARSHGYLPLKVNFKETKTVQHCKFAPIIIEIQSQYQLQTDLNDNNCRNMSLNRIISIKTPHETWEELTLIFKDQLPTLLT